MTTNPVSLRDAARLVDRVRRALECGVGDVRSNDTVHSLLAIAEQWVAEQGRTGLTDLTGLSKPFVETDGRLPECARPALGGIGSGDSVLRCDVQQMPPVGPTLNPSSDEANSGH